MEEGKQKALTPASASLTALTAMGWDRDQIDLIKRTVAKGATDDELSLFLYQCKRMGLDPLSRQAHFVKRWDSSQQREVGAIQIGIDGFRSIAEDTGQYRADEEPPRFTYEKDGNLRSAKVAVYRFHPETGSWYRVETEAFYKEYCQFTKAGEPNAIWKKMPHNQLAKCSEALSIRKSNPRKLGGFYIHEEMPAVEDRPPVSMPAETVIPPTIGQTGLTAAVVSSTDGILTITEVTRKTGTKKKGGSYTKYGVKDSEGNWYNTFSETLFKTAQKAKELTTAVNIEYDADDYGRELTAIVPVAFPGPSPDKAPENLFVPEPVDG